MRGSVLLKDNLSLPLHLATLDIMFLVPINKHCLKEHNDINFIMDKLCLLCLFYLVLLPELVD